MLRGRSFRPLRSAVDIALTILALDRLPQALHIYYSLSLMRNNFTLFISYSHRRLGNLAKYPIVRVGCEFYYGACLPAESEV